MNLNITGILGKYISEGKEGDKKKTTYNLNAFIRHRKCHKERKNNFIPNINKY
jgi:hypothetical protein